ncbi:hypothetical protein JRQ81_015486 [Phrynocephalus forsythii]|uniref:Uncharacterized protein n=1 Tax=Phrynocephalus forsythii TaxID=171643 RepID=A0A9Q1B2C0_9SAUR|nr:hypothetical protein JRQ81_015486 [Phrynocephalus forsythii]
MGEGMSKKKNLERGLQVPAVHTLVEEHRLGGSQVHTTMEKVTPSLHQSTWPGPRQISLSRVSTSSLLDPEGSIRKSAQREEDWERDLLFEDCQEIFLEGPPLLAKDVQAEKSQECGGLEVGPGPRLQGQTWVLSKDTQTEAAWSDSEDWPYCEAGRDPPSSVYMLEVAKCSEKALQQGLREFFGFLTLLMKIPTLFVIELTHFLGKAVFQMLVVDLITAVGDEMLAPLLAALLHSVFQPLLIFLLKVLSGVRDLSVPAMDILKDIFLQVAVVVKAFRLVEVHHHPVRPYAEQV